ncbi:MAG: carboxypeptidase-like regulatory domain-containing protein [Planctomycetota bacterium]
MGSDQVKWKQWGMWVLLGAVLTGWAPTAADAQVSGTVRDANTLAPIDGAIVTLRGTSVQTTTDALGNFSLPTVMGSGLQVVAAKRGYYHQRPPGPTFAINTPATGVIYDLEPLGVLNDPTYIWKQNSSCGFCHNDQESSYTGSPMNLTGQNLWVYDLYSGNGTPGGMGGFVYTQDSVHAATDPDSDCASCHQPEHWISSNMASVPLSNIANPSQDAGDGVSCEICHKVRDVDPSLNEDGFGGPGVNISRPGNALGATQVMYGPLGDVAYIIPDAMNPSVRKHELAESPLNLKFKKT